MVAQVHDTAVSKSEVLLNADVSAKGNPKSEHAVGSAVKHASNSLLNSLNNANNDPAPQSSGNSNPFGDDPYMQELMVDAELDVQFQKLRMEVTNDLNKQIDNTLAEQKQEAQDLKNQIQQLQDELKKDLSPAQIAKLKDQLGALEKQLDSAEAALAADQGAVNSAQNNLNQDQTAYNNLKDKTTPAAKALLKKIQEDQAAVTAAKGKVAADQKQIQDVKNSLTDLIKAYPQEKTLIEGIINSIDNGKYANAFKAADSQLDELAKEVAAIPGQIQALQQQQNDLAKNIQNIVNSLKNSINQVQELSVKVEQEKEASEKILNDEKKRSEEAQKEAQEIVNQSYIEDQQKYARLDFSKRINAGRLEEERK